MLARVFGAIGRTHRFGAKPPQSHGLYRGARRHDGALMTMTGVIEASAMCFIGTRGGRVGVDSGLYS